MYIKNKDASQVEALGFIFLKANAKCGYGGEREKERKEMKEERKRERRKEAKEERKQGKRKKRVLLRILKYLCNMR